MSLTESPSSKKRPYWVLPIIVLVTGSAVALSISYFLNSETLQSLGWAASSGRRDHGGEPTYPTQVSSMAELSTATLRHELVNAPNMRTPSEIVYGSRTAIEGIKQAEMLFGAKDYRVDRLKLAIVGLCKGNVDPTGSLRLNDPDPTRDWAIEATLKYCQDWSESEHSPQGADNSPDFLFVLDKKLGTEAALLEAEKRITQANDWLDINDALGYLNEHGRLPTPTALGMRSDDFGPVDVNEALLYATSVISCDLAGGCGPNAPLTLSFCIRIGCRQGSSLLDGLHAHLPPKQFELLLAYRRWFFAQRHQGN